jgi:hypothetical protein
MAEASSPRIRLDARGRGGSCAAGGRARSAEGFGCVEASSPRSCPDARGRGGACAARLASAICRGLRVRRSVIAWEPPGRPRHRRVMRAKAVSATCRGLSVSKRHRLEAAPTPRGRGGSCAAGLASATCRRLRVRRSVRLGAAGRPRQRRVMRERRASGPALASAAGNDIPDPGPLARICAWALGSQARQRALDCVWSARTVPPHPMEKGACSLRSRLMEQGPRGAQRMNRRQAHFSTAPSSAGRLPIRDDMAPGDPWSTPSAPRRLRLRDRRGAAPPRRPAEPADSRGRIAAPNSPGSRPCLRL